MGLLSKVGSLCLYGKSDGAKYIISFGDDADGEFVPITLTSVKGENFSTICFMFNRDENKFYSRTSFTDIAKFKQFLADVDLSVAE